MQAIRDFLNVREENREDTWLLGALQVAVQLELNDFESEPRRQRAKPRIKLTTVTSQINALRAISLIKEQGEGTAIGPFFDANIPDSIAHFYRFGEIFNEHRVKIVNFQPVYSGAPLPFLSDASIYPMAPVPKGGDAASDACLFNEKFSDMLRNLEAAWSLDGDTQADAKLVVALAQ